ncbi:MAG: ECF transporter S component [Candidatus Lokiarchaeota archaeon]|nr:ECF transporter S component [Candidatus Lokiarchaeota archaeon]
MENSKNANKDQNTNENQQRVVFPAKGFTKQIILHIAITAIMIGLNTVVTVVFTVYLPLSNGFFNIGESMVYLTAILFGPYIGAISSGVGAALADIFLTYTHYALGTLVIKGVEALIVGFLYQKLMQIAHNVQEKRNSKTRETVTVIFIAIIITIIILSVGFIFYIGPAEISGFKDLYVFNIKFTYIFWSGIAGINLLSIILIYVFVDSRISLKIIAMFVGGIFMIIGYLIYGTFIIGIATAYSEMPFNLLQVCVGIAIAVPISGPIKTTLKL